MEVTVKMETDSPESSTGRKRKNSEQDDEKPKPPKSKFVYYVTEAEVGISQYVGKHSGFTCTLKERYSDFIVHEKTLSGDLVTLDSLDLPSNEDTSDERSIDEVELIPDEMKPELDKIVDGSRTEPLRIQVDGIGKQDRKKYHHYIKVQYPTLKSDTVMADSHKYIEVSVRTAEDEKRIDLWPKERGAYCHFVMYKENIDTLSAVFAICRVLKKAINQFSYAGVKDRRAITSQAMSVRRVTAEELRTVNSKLNAVKVGNFTYKPEFLHLGDLSANHYELLLRNSEGSKEDVDTSMQSLRDNGFINYFGMQRFGSTSVPSFRIGQSLLHGDHKKVVDLILQPRKDSKSKNSEITKCREIWNKSKSARKALKALSAKNGVEGRLLSGLLSVRKTKDPYSRNRRPPDPFQVAVSHIPANVRSMYVHSYQSYVWNKVASKRVELLGMAPSVGDLFIKEQFCEQDFESDSLDKARDKSRKDRAKIVDPEFVTEENIDTVELKDIVLPIPGFKVKYPKNEAGEWCKKFLSQDNLYSSNHRNFQEVGLPGSYRRLIVIPTDVEWEIFECAEAENLVVTDFMKVSPYTADSHEMAHSDKKLKTEEEKKDLPVVRMCFSLPPSSYATMAIREATKLERDVLCQAGVSDGYSSGGEEEEALKQGARQRHHREPEYDDLGLDELKYAWV